MTSAIKVINDLFPLLEILGWSAVFVGCIRFATGWYDTRRAEMTKTGGDWRTTVLDFALWGVKGDKSFTPKPDQAPQARPEISASTLASICFSFVGLQVSFLTWGWVQERIMTTQYGGLEKFPSSNMLVLSNRVFAILFSFLVIRMKASPPSTTVASRPRAPFFAFAFPAIANTVSSFAAYESLRFMSFPMSTVCKTLKIVPTMLMGTVIHRKLYSRQEYASALLITCGAALFAVEFGAGGLEGLLAQSKDVNLVVALPGLVLMAVYLAVDAFTSNLQTLLFKEYLLTPYECMLGINVFSIFLSVFNLAQSNQLVPATLFLARYPQALGDLVLLALSSASGQLFIYYTIERHGPVTFTIIQLTRQLLAILLSSWTFGHQVNLRAWAGILMTFSGIFAMNVAGKKAVVKKKGE